MRFISTHHLFIILGLLFYSSCAYVNGDYQVEMVLEKANQKTFTVEESQLTLGILADRLRVYGFSERNFDLHANDNQISAQVRYVDKPKRIKMLLSTRGKLGFCELYYNSAALQERLQRANSTLQKLDNQFAKHTPLLDMFTLSKNMNEPIIGFIEPDKVKQLSKAFQMPAVREFFPPDLTFAIAAKALAGKSKKLYRLYALKAKNRPLLDNRMVLNAYPSLDDAGRAVVLVEMTPKATQEWANITKHYLNKHLAIVMDGRVYAAPLVHQQITNGQARITGNFDQSTAQDLADILELGVLPAPLSIISENVVKRQDGN